jgi:hypothetical protein
MATQLKPQADMRILASCAETGTAPWIAGTYTRTIHFTVNGSPRPIWNTINYMKRSKEVYPLLQKLQGYGGGADALRLRLLAYLFQDKLDITTQGTFGELTKAVDLFMRNTLVVLLELKLWKTACIVHAPESLKGMRAVVHWMDEDWKEKKAAMRCHELVHVGMHNILPFLEKPW